MDAEHEATLKRILAEREKRGGLLDRRALTGRQTAVAAAEEDLRHQRELDAARAAAAQQQQQQLSQAALISAQQQQQQQQQQQYFASRDAESATAPPSPDHAAGGRVPYQPQQQQQQQQQQQFAAPAARTSSLNAGSGGASPSASTSAAAAAAHSPIDSLFERGKFDNFRTSPMLVTNTKNLRPYVKGAGTATRTVVKFGEMSGGGGGGGDRHHDARSNSSASPSASGGAATPGTAGRGSSVVSGGASSQRYPNGNGGNGGGGALPRGASAVQMASAARYRGDANNLDVDAYQVTEPNPFRGQTFEQFCVAPDEDKVPEDIRRVLKEARSPLVAVNARSSQVWNHKGDQLIPPMEGATVQPMVGAPLFNFQAACGILVTGDWFLKWTRHKDKVHRRFFRVTPDGDVLAWAMTPEAGLAFASVVRIADIASVEPSCVVDEATNQTVYVMTIWSTTRVTQLGTEYREKFDIWYETLRRLSMRQTSNSHAFSSRHATMVVQDQTAASLAMVMRRNLMGGKIASTD